jgi:prevent-host-death family protein
VELKNKTNELLREVMKGNPLIITYRGKPAASILLLSEDDLEDFIIGNSPSIRKKILKAEEDLKAGS